MPEAGAHPGCRPCGQPVLQRDQHPLLRLLQGGGVHGAELVGEVRERDQVKQWKYIYIKGAPWRKRSPSQSGRNHCPTGTGVFEDQCGGKVCDAVQILVLAHAEHIISRIYQLHKHISLSCMCCPIYNLIYVLWFKIQENQT